MDIKICCHNCKETSTYSVNLTTHIEVVRVVEEIPSPRIVSRTTVQNTPGVQAPQYIMDIIARRKVSGETHNTFGSIESFLTHPE